MSMSQFPAVQPPLAVVDGGRKKRAGLPKLLHKFFFKVLRLRPAASALEGRAATFEAYYGHGHGYRMVDDEYYYYSYGGVGSSWAGVLSSIPEEESSDGTPDAVVGPAVLRKAHSERFVAAEAAGVVHLEVVL